MKGSRFDILTSMYGIKYEKEAKDRQTYSAINSAVQLARVTVLDVINQGLTKSAWEPSFHTHLPK
jgi:hypothetical protein